MSELNNRDYLLLKAYQAGIADPRELAAFMGQMQIESGGFGGMHERLDYGGRRLLEVFPGRNGINTLAEAETVTSGGPESVANAVYGGEWGHRNLGNTEPGDGWRFHGRGYVQLTGRDNYARAERELGLTLTDNPDLAADRDNAVNIALHYWNGRVVPREHQLDVRAATFDINGGYNHLPERRAAVASWEQVLTPEVMERLSQGEVALPQMPGMRATTSDPTIQAIQHSLNQLGITDARGQPLVVDGNRGGPSSRTNEAIAAFQQHFGLEGQMSSAELLAATQVALNNPLRKLDQSMQDLLPPNLQSQAPRMVNGMPDYLLPGRNPPTPHHNTPPSQPAESAALPPLPTAELQPGDRGAAVLALQQHLRLIGATDRDGRELKGDRDYGPRTKEAVEQFQLWTGRETTGIADQDTLQALQVQAQFAARQRARGIASGQHLADNLKPEPAAPTDARLASDPRLPPAYETVRATPSTPEPVGLQPFSHPDHPQHALYADVQQRFQAKGHALSEAQLSVLTGQMHATGATPGWQGDVTVRDGKAVAMATWPPGMRADIDLTTPAPSVQETMKNFQAEQQNMAQTMERLNQQQAMAQEHGHGVSR